MSPDGERSTLHIAAITRPERHLFSRKIDGYEARLDHDRGYLLHGRGKTAKDARTDLLQQVEQALDGSYQPHVLTAEGHTVIVWRELAGWQYAMIGREPAREEVCGLWGTSERSFDDAMRAGRKRLAAELYRLGRCLCHVVDERDREEQHRSERWTELYRDAEALGAEDPHRVACEAISYIDHYDGYSPKVYYARRQRLAEQAVVR